MTFMRNCNEQHLFTRVVVENVDVDLLLVLYYVCYNTFLFLGFFQYLFVYAYVGIYCPMPTASSLLPICSS